MFCGFVQSIFPAHIFSFRFELKLQPCAEGLVSAMESPACSAYHKATACYKAGDYRSALAHFDEAVRLARKEKNWEVLALALQYKGIIHHVLGQVNAVFIFSSFSLFLIPRVSTTRLWPAIARQSL